MLDNRDTLELSLIKEVLLTYGASLVLLLFGVLPGLNMLYSGHGGIAWLMLPVALPLGLIGISYRIFKSRSEIRKKYFKFIIFSLPLYMILAYLLSWMAVYSIHKSYGLKVDILNMYKLAIFPFGLPL